jgi:3-hydroxybutyryl-CoA dehydrogenase/5-formyl-3-hydroxy-2-methylpyridine 4-carboxylate dehydrogenase
MTPAKITTVAVAGAGTMGPGIAATFASHGFDVRLTDVKPEMRERAQAAANTVYATLVKEGFLSQPQADAGRARLQIVADVQQALGGADFVVETIPEVADLKQAFFRQAESLVRDDTILASNTSGIPITRLAEGCRLRERVIGMHWSNPPHIIPVIEIIRGERTGDAAVAATREVVRRLDMLPVDVRRDVPGFVENRILYAIMREALHLLDEGVASAEDIDAIVKWGVGYKLAVIPPLQLLDVAGLDTYHNVASYLNADLSASGEVSALVRQKVAEGQLGIKSGKGLFDYAPDDLPKLMGRRMRLLLDVKKALAE